MQAINQIFNKVLVIPYYRAHTIPFLFFFLVVFGSVDAGNLVQFHYSLLLAAFGTPSLLALFMLGWSLYMANGYHSVVTYLRKPENQFVSLAAGCPTSLLLVSLSGVILTIDAPVIIYILIGIGIALYKSLYLSAGLAVLFLVMTIAGQVLASYRILRLRHRLGRFSFELSLFNIRYKPSVFSISLRHVLYERKLLLAGVKISSSLLLYAAHYEWHAFGYDIRWMEIALGPGLAIHGLLMYSLWSFDRDFLSFTRGFPERLWRRYLQISGLASLLLLPEFTLLLSYTIHFGIAIQYPVLLIFMISVPMFHYALLYTNDFDTEGYHSILFALVLISFFACLFYIGWLLALLFLIVSFIVFMRSYYSFEKKIA